MIDIHTHILPSIDDGSRDAAETFDMINEAYDAGFTDIITTSHYITEQYEVNKNERNLLLNAIQNKVDVENINLILHNGAEAYIMPNLSEYYNEGVIPTLANSRYGVFEFPMHSKVLYGNDVIEDLIKNDYIPIIAHPERYTFVQKDISIAFEWIEKGALLQSNYGSIVEQYGKAAKKIFIKLLQENAITFLGTDSHRRKGVYTEINDIIDELKKYTTNDNIEKMTRINQQKVINNEEIF